MVQIRVTQLHTTNRSHLCTMLLCAFPLNAESCVFLHYSPAIQYICWKPQHLDSDLCHQRAQSDAAHEYRSSSFDGCGGAEACTARRLRLPPLCSALLCGCGRWRCLKTGIRLVLWRCQPPLHSAATVIRRQEIQLWDVPSRNRKQTWSWFNYMRYRGRWFSCIN